MAIFHFLSNRVNGDWRLAAIYRENDKNTYPLI